MVTIDEAYQYLNNERLFADAWLMSDNSKQEQSLKMATNQIMSLKFNSYSDDNRENNIKKAICEQALYLLETLNTQRNKMQQQGVSSFSVEGLSESYDLKAKKVICVEAKNLISIYLLGVASIC